MIARALFALSLLAGVFASQAPVAIKVAQSGKQYASPSLLAAVLSEVSSAAREEVDFFVKELGTAKSSFLKTVPMPEHIKNGMYLSESLRSPNQMSVNVVEREPTHVIGQSAKYNGLEAKTRALNSKFRLALAAMKAGH